MERTRVTYSDSEAAEHVEGSNPLAPARRLVVAVGFTLQATPPAGILLGDDIAVRPLNLLTSIHGSDPANSSQSTPRPSNWQAGSSTGPAVQVVAEAAKGRLRDADGAGMYWIRGGGGLRFLEAIDNEQLNLNVLR